MKQLLWYHAANEINKCHGTQATTVSQEKNRLNISSLHMFNGTTCFNENGTPTGELIFQHTSTTVAPPDVCEIREEFSE